MSGSPHIRRRSAWWRAGLLCLLAALAFAPVARAVCDLQHAVATAHQQPSCHDAPAPDLESGHVGVCCDGALATMTQQAGALPESGPAPALAVTLIAVAAAPVVPLVPRLAAPDVPRSRSPAPYEPILLRLPRRLI